MAEIKFKAKSNAVEFAKRLTNFAVEFERAHKKALVVSTEKMRKDLYLEMRAVFDRPTRFTLNSLETVHPESGGTATENEGIVRTKLGFGSVPAGRYLDPQVEGGDRRKKALEKSLGEFVVPSRYADLDNYGNVPGGQVRKIISNLRLAGDPTSNSSSSSASKRKRSGATYFRQGNIIFQRSSAFGHSQGPKPITPVFILIGQSPRYRKRFRFYEVAEATAERVYPKVFEGEIEKALMAIGF